MCMWIHISIDFYITIIVIVKLPNYKIGCIYFLYVYKQRKQ